MEIITPEKLADAIERAGTTPAALALAIDRDKDYIRDYLVGRKRSLKAGDLQKIAAKLNTDGTFLTMKEIALTNDLPAMPVIGTIRAGTWIETFMLEHDEEGEIPVSRDLRFPYARQYALAVSGDSMDQMAPDGSFVVCVDFGESGLRLSDGMVAHVESHEHGKSETTLKEVQHENGHIALVPRSSNPIYKPILLGGDGGVEVVVKGIVLSVYNPLKL